MSPVTEGKLRLGGMALRNGLLVHGPTHWAAAVRDNARARSQVASGPQAARARRRRACPGVRGVVRLGEALRGHPARQARAARSAKLPVPGPGA